MTASTCSARSGIETWTAGLAMAVLCQVVIVPDGLADGGPPAPSTLAESGEVASGDVVIPIPPEIKKMFGEIERQVREIEKELRDIQGKIGEIEPTVDGIRTTVDDTKEEVDRIDRVTPDRPEIRGLNRTLDIEAIADTLVEVEDLLGGALSIATLMRDGYESWYGTGCDAASRCAAFKGDLRKLFADFGESARLLQAISCIDRPGIEIRPFHTGLAEELVLEKAPPVALFGLAKTLDRVAPPGDKDGGWKTLLSDVLGELPEPFRRDLVALCEPTPEGSPAAAGGPVCRILRPEEVGLALKAARGRAHKKKANAELLNFLTKDEITITAGAVAVGGATGGYNVKNPMKVTTDALEGFLDALPDRIGDLIEQRNLCLEAEADIESDLGDCQPPVSVLLQETASLRPHPAFSDVKAVVELRIEQVHYCRDQGSCQDLDLSSARQYFQSAEQFGATPDGYRYLCCAYDELVGGAADLCS